MPPKLRETHYQEARFPKGAQQYIRECLEEGNSLARHLLTQLDPDSGTVSAFLPPHVAPDSATRFRYGGIAHAEESEACLITLVQAFLSRRERRLCLFENALAQPHDPVLASAETRLCIFKDEVYHFLSEQDNDSQKIRQTIRAAASPYLCIGVLTSLPQESQILCETQRVILTSDEVLRGLAERAETIVVGAYDGEGYLIWQRASCRSG